MKARSLSERDGRNEETKIHCNGFGGRPLRVAASRMITVRFHEGKWQVVQSAGAFEHVWASCKTEAIALERAAIFQKQHDATAKLLNEWHERAIERMKK